MDDFTEEIESLKDELRQDFKDILLESGFSADQVENEIKTLFSSEVEKSIPLAATKVNFKDLFEQIFLEILQVETGFGAACDSLRSVFLNNGIKINPDQLFARVDLVSTRLSMASIVKQLCYGLGLQDEYARILEHELNVIYKSRLQSNSTSTIAGESDDGTN